jgi:hypothetical protein
MTLPEGSQTVRPARALPLKAFNRLGYSEEGGCYTVYLQLEDVLPGSGQLVSDYLRWGRCSSP